YTSHSWCVEMPSAPTRNPIPQQSAATKPLFRGPWACTHLPKIAAETPSTAIARVKIQPSSVSFQSPGIDLVTPSCLVKGRLNTLNAYACPIQRCVARAHGGINQRLKPGFATIRSLLKSSAMGEPPDSEVDHG